MSFEADDFFAIPLQILTPEQRDEFEIVFTPEMERVKRVVIKNARGHALYELDRGMSFEADDFFAIPLQNPDAGATRSNSSKRQEEQGNYLVGRKSAPACSNGNAERRSPT